MNKLYLYIILLFLGCSKGRDYSYSSQVYHQQTESLITGIVSNNLIIHPDSIRKYIPHASFKLSPEITHKGFYWTISDDKGSILTQGAMKLPLATKAFFEAANRDTTDWIINVDSVGIYKVTSNCEMSRDNFCVHFYKPVFSPDYKKAYVRIDLISEGKALWLENVHDAWTITKMETTWVE